MSDSVNRGKDFENNVRDDFERIGVYSLRLYDTMNIYGVKNPCDVIVSNSPITYLFECKSCHKASLSKSEITDYQWKELLKASKYPGVRAGYLIWFIDKKVTYFVSADNMESYLQKHKTKSFNYKLLEDYAITLTGKQKQIYCEYDMEDLFCKMEGYYENR